ncbi:MAG: ParB/RepB/Spo0J family partition protein [Candidatus Scatomorpha sp.]
MARVKKGLGQGLDALFQTDRSEEIEKRRGSVSEVPIERLSPGKAQPRKDFAGESIAELAASISEHGLISPIIVREFSEGIYEIIAGERRWRAAKLVGLSEVPVRVIEASDAKAAELSIVENIQRKDLNAIEEASAIKALGEEYALSHEELAKKLGISRPAITNKLRLLNLPEEIQKLLRDGKISPGHARALITLEPKERQLALAYEIDEKGLSVRQTEERAKALMRPPKKKSEESELRRLLVRDVENRLEESLGRKVKLKESRKGGSITLTYYDADDRERLIEELRALSRRNRGK